MIKQILALGFTMMAVSAQANDWEAASAEFNESYLQVEACFANEVTNQEACVVAGIQECVNDLEGVLESKGLPIPGGASVSPHEYCNYIGAGRADARNVMRRARVCARYRQYRRAVPAAARSDRS